MRLVILAILAASTALPAFASSIEFVAGTHLGNDSMVSMSCATCPPVKPPEERSGYKVPTLGEGVQKEEILTINGERMLVRTDRWMGGSPIVYHQKLTPETEAAMTAKPVINGIEPPVAAGVTGQDGVDPTATTAAVSAEPAKAASDFGGFELRLK